MIRPAAALLALTLVPALLAPPAAAEVRRLVVEGVATGSEESAGVPRRRAAVDRALRRAVLQVAQELVGGTLLGPAEGEGGWIQALGSDPSPYVLRYRVMDDRGERPAAGRASGGATEYVVRVEAHVDGQRVAAQLRESGYPVAVAAPGPASAFRVELRDVSSWRAYAALRRHLLERAGARSAQPESFEAGRAVLRVEAPGGPAGLLGRLRDDPPPGLRLEPLAVDDAVLALRVRGGGDRPD